jgi:predicted alpha/beta-hydrolase family hydrolase
MITSKPILLFAPGAGAPSTHPWMRAWAERLGTIGNVRTFDYDYMREGRRRPDPPALLIAAHRQALRDARTDDAQPVILIGKSMGGRIGCHVSLEEPVTALVCLGYPLCGAGDATRLRDKVLRDLRTPILFVQGTRDPLCPLDLLESVRKEMKAPNFLHVVEGGDHSLMVAKRHLQKTGETQEQVDAQVLGAIEGFVKSIGWKDRSAGPSS